MFNPSGEYSENRPFKIFISLLDKWEIGAPLTEVLVYDSFRAIKQHMGKPAESAEDVRQSLCLHRRAFMILLDVDDSKHRLRRCRATGCLEDVINASS